MTSVAIAMRAARSLKAARIKQKKALYIAAMYKAHLETTGNPMTSPNFYQKAFMLNINDNFAKVVG